MDSEQVYKKNLAYAKPKDNYQTVLPVEDEVRFAKWQLENKVPFDPSPQADYDMRGFYQALQAKDPRAISAINPNDNRMHYPDYWKTPYHKSFSNESQWATPNAPKWNELDQLVLPKGQVVFDERAVK
jgi:hypothetical protein